jgi:Cu-processing system permease protein
MKSQTLAITGLTIRDVSRSRWLIACTLFFALAAGGLLRFSDSPLKALVALSSVILFVVPLASLVFGSMYLYSAREFVELLLAQPLERRALFAGLYAGLVLPMCGGIVVGVGAPLLLSVSDAQAMRVGALLILLALALCAAFTGLATVIVNAVDDRVRGLSASLGAWLVLAVIYDGFVLFIASRYAEWPLDRPMLGLMLANPIDLSRVLLLRQFDAQAFRGYTGAVYEKFFAGSSGLFVGFAALVVWIAAPAGLGARLFRRRDF